MTASPRVPPSGLERFTLGRVLGQGSYGVVYSAFDRQRGTEVALKVLHRVGPDALLRFKREFRALVELRHPGLVELGELFEDEGTWFFSMELVEGRDLIAHATARGEESEPFAALRDALAQLADALAALHARGQAHRDLKPSNTRVTASGRVVLLDFGLIAGVDDGASTAERVVGTIGYMAPEQAAGEPAGAPADCYALGVMLFEALTGRLPFVGTPLEIMRAKQAEPAPRLLALAPHAPPDLAQLVADLLEREPARRPTAVAVAARLRSLLEPCKRRSTPRLALARPTLLGRDLELAQLIGALRDVQAGEPRQALVYGTAGVGKTALARALLEVARGEPGETIVLAGRCLEQESVPYNAFDAVIDALSQQLGRMPREQVAAILPRRFGLLTRAFPVLDRIAEHTAPAPAPRQRARTDEPTLRDAAFAALRELFQRLSERRTIVLWIDDWHWADDDSLELLERLVRAPDAPLALTLLTLRPLDECSPSVRASIERVRAQPAARALELSVLSEEAARSVAFERLRALGHAPEPVRAAEIARDAGGNPSLIDWLARAATTTFGARALDEAVLRSMRALPSDARTILQLLCVAAQPLDGATLCAALDRAPQAIATALDALRREALVRTHPAVEAAVEPFNARARDAVRATLTGPELCALHAALARALELAHGEELEAIAAHWEAAGDAVRAARQLARAAEVADRALASARAAALYERALAEPSAFADAERHALYVQRAHALASSGQGGPAAEAYRAAARLAPETHALELALLAARSATLAGDLARGFQWLAETFAHTGLRWPRSTAGVLASLLFERSRLALRGISYVERAEAELDAQRLREVDALWSATGTLAGIDMLRCAELHARALRLALELGEPRRLVRSLALESVAAAGAKLQRSFEPRGRLAHAEQLAAKLEDPYSIAFTQLAWGMHHMMRGEMRECRERARRATAAWAEQSFGALWELSYARFMEVIAATHLGELRETRERYEVARLDAEARGNRAAAHDLVAGMRWAIDLTADAPDALEAELERLERELPAGAVVQRTYVMSSRLWLSLYRGGEDAHRYAERCWPQLERSQVLRTTRARVVLTQQRAGAALAALKAGGSHGPLRRVIARCAEQLESEQLEDAAASARVIRAQLAMHDGDRTGALAHLRAVLAERSGAARSLLQRVAEHRLGRVLGDSEGKALAGATLDWAEREGVRDPERFIATFMPIDALRQPA